MFVRLGILLSFACAPIFWLVGAISIIQNTATGYVFDDWEFQSSAPQYSLGCNDSIALTKPSADYGGIIDGFTFGPAIIVYQIWTLTTVAGSYFKFSAERTFAPSPLHIEVHVDGLPGAGLTAQKYGSLFQYVNPYGAGTIYAFIFALEEPELAITAPNISGGQLTLQPYNATNTLQHWVFFNVTPPPEAAPHGALSSPIPIPLDTAESGSAAFAKVSALISAPRRPGGDHTVESSSARAGH